MDEKQVAGVAGLQEAAPNSDLAESATLKNPAKPAGNPNDCRTSIRENLRRIRDSDHPARHAARNVIQIMDTMDGDDPTDVGALRKAVVAFQRAMGAGLNELTDQRELTVAELADRFWLGRHYIDHQ